MIGAAVLTDRHEEFDLFQFVCHGFEPVREFIVDEDCPGVGMIDDIEIFPGREMNVDADQDRPDHRYGIMRFEQRRGVGQMKTTLSPGPMPWSRRLLARRWTLVWNSR
jgi:hypothetical protein